MRIRVNGQEIPPASVEFELNRLIKFYSEHMSAGQLNEQMALLRQKAVDQAIGAKLLLDEASRLDIEPTEEDIEGRIRQMMKDAGGEKAFVNALAKQRLTLDVLRDGLRRGRRVDLLVERIVGTISDPTEEEMRQHFSAHAEEYRTADRAQAQHILIRPPTAGDDDRREARSRLADIRRKLQDGADFAEMAAAHSECPSGRKTGGSLGWVNQGSLLPEIDSVIFSMEAGELSEVVESPLGYHLIRKVAQEQGGTAEYADVADRVRDFLRHARRGQALAGYVTDLRKKASVEIVEEDVPGMPGSLGAESRN